MKMGLPTEQYNHGDMQELKNVTDTTNAYFVMMQKLWSVMKVTNSKKQVRKNVTAHVQNNPLLVR